jgi:hypothetical protein
MAAVPTPLGNTANRSLLQELEIYYLSNPDPQLSFALLTDFTDAPAQSMPQDAQLLSLAITGIEGLNQKYASVAPFYLFHRQRDWNPSEGVWMGWERKRGKLAVFNQMLLNAELSEPRKSTEYIAEIGDLSILPEIKYVITLDADTSLPHGSASRLVATMAHPLNQAEFTTDGYIVVAGYTVLQPRVEIKPTSANCIGFHRYLRGMPDLICTHWPFRMYIKTCLERAVTSARAFMMWQLSSAAWSVRCAKTRCSAMISLREFTVAPRW